ncbi:probable sugar phosphate/phosphate translocator At2g25520 [Lycium barbarum]|uniref:probable sugar phosphate/phosphate translocator At2g25520 n=1 Tax=Lycium barbarum TaxID=112863 RepID=UPI00293F6AA3|nr:probable sugar phosphate/phosphate translocator At2g25520 [Lycium barbarum]
MDKSPNIGLRLQLEVILASYEVRTTCPSKYRLDGSHPQDPNGDATGKEQDRRTTKDDIPTDDTDGELVQILMERYYLMSEEMDQMRQTIVSLASGPQCSSPAQISLTMIHMTFCSSLGFRLVRVFKVVEPVSLSRKVYLTCILPIGALYSVSLWLSNSAYIYLSVSFIQMLKALMPVAVYTIGILFKKDGFKNSTMGNMLAISVGVAIAAYGEAKYDSWGVLLQLLAVLFEATRLVMIQILLTSKGISLNPITSLYYVAPSCLVFLSIPCIFVELPVLRENSSFQFDFVSGKLNGLKFWLLPLFDGPASLLVHFR